MRSQAPQALLRGVREREGGHRKVFAHNRATTQACPVLASRAGIYSDRPADPGDRAAAVGCGLTVAGQAGWDCADSDRVQPATVDLTQPSGAREKGLRVPKRSVAALTHSLAPPTSEARPGSHDSPRGPSVQRRWSRPRHYLSTRPYPEAGRSIGMPPCLDSLAVFGSPAFSLVRHD